MKKKNFSPKFQCRQKTTADLDLARVLLTCGRDNKRRPIKGLLHSRSDRSTGGQMDPKYLGRSAIKTFNSVPCHPILDGTSDWPLVTFEKKTSSSVGHWIPTICDGLLLLQLEGGDFVGHVPLLFQVAIKVALFGQFQRRGSPNNRRPFLWPSLTTHLHLPANNSLVFFQKSFNAAAFGCNCGLESGRRDR